jgi:ribonuclease HII
MAPKTATPAKVAAKTATATATKAAAANRAKRAKVLVPTSKVPSLNVERLLWSEGHRVVVGVDEVGRGAWAGPLMVGAAVLPQDRRVYKVRDSKMLSEAQRERLFDRVAEWCVAWAVGGASQVECDELGMAEAQRVAARRAIEGLGVTPDQVLVDGNWDFVGLGCTKRIVKGDITCLSISAASILAKVTRDRVMRAEAPHFPAYDFDSNKGYPCPRHKMALQAFGPTAIHRRTWVFMDHTPWGGRIPHPLQASLFDAPDPDDAE